MSFSTFSMDIRRLRQRRGKRNCARFCKARANFQVTDFIGNLRERHGAPVPNWCAPGAAAPNWCTHPLGYAARRFAGRRRPFLVRSFMFDLFAALLLGIIEGITEFLPISSTGHLLIAERWLGHRSDLFNIGIQAGAILAVVVIYWKRLWGMLSAFVGHDAPAPFDPLGVTATPAQSRDYAYKLLAAFAVTVAGGLLVKQLGWQLPDTVQPIAWALILGAVWMVAAEHLAAKRAA